MLRTLMAIAVAGAFALPVAALASATNDNIVVAQGGGGDTGASNRQEGVNPPGQASPGTPRSAASGIDRDTGAASRTNPTGKGAMGATAKHGRFEALDKNHDGFISRDEAKDAAELNTRFTELDANNDGKLSREEYNGVNASARGATGSTADSTATGKAKAKAGAPDKGPGAQEPANRALGTAGSGVPEGGGTSTSK